MITFKQFFIEKQKYKKNRKKPGLKKRKNVDREKPLGRQRYDMLPSRGVNRKSLKYVPDYRTATPTGELAFSSFVVDQAKNANRGLWRVTKRQAFEIGSFYQFNLPNKKTPLKQLSNTKIYLWRRRPGEFYLVKGFKGLTKKG